MQALWEGPYFCTTIQSGSAVLLRCLRPVSQPAITMAAFHTLHTHPAATTPHQKTEQSDRSVKRCEEVQREVSPKLGDAPHTTRARPTGDTHHVESVMRAGPAVCAEEGEAETECLWEHPRNACMPCLKEDRNHPRVLPPPVFLCPPPPRERAVLNAAAAAAPTLCALCGWWTSQTSSVEPRQSLT